jgi:hypothetical protein
MAIRHIREVLDADVVNSSETLYIVKTWINKYQNEWALAYGGMFNVPFNFPYLGTQAGWLAVAHMGDNQGTFPSSWETPDPPGSGNEQLGIHPHLHLIHLDYTLANYGQAAGSYGNSGFKHLFHTVQFAKGAGDGSTGNFMENGSANLAPVHNQNNTYKQTNLKFSDFHGVKKNATNNDYIYGDSISEQVVTVGAISIGNRAGVGGPSI